MALIAFVGVVASHYQYEDNWKSQETVATDKAPDTTALDTSLDTATDTTSDKAYDAASDFQFHKAMKIK